MKMRKGGLIAKLSRIYRKKVEAIIIAHMSVAWSEVNLGW